MTEFTSIRLCTMLEQRGPLTKNQIEELLGLTHQQAKNAIKNAVFYSQIGPLPKINGEPVKYQFLRMPRPSARKARAGGVTYSSRALPAKRPKAIGSGVIPQGRYIPPQFKVLQRGDISERAELCMLAR